MKYSWWIIQIGMIVLSLFFTIFGIDLLISAYLINNPYTFIMLFFSASFIILISLTLFTGFIIKIVRMYKYLKTNTENSDQTVSNNESSVKENTIE